MTLEWEISLIENPQIFPTIQINFTWHSQVYKDHFFVPYARVNDDKIL